MATEAPWCAHEHTTVVCFERAAHCQSLQIALYHNIAVRSLLQYISELFSVPCELGRVCRKKTAQRKPGTWVAPYHLRLCQVRWKSSLSLLKAC